MAQREAHILAVSEEIRGLGQRVLCWLRVVSIARFKASVEQVAQPPPVLEIRNIAAVAEGGKARMVVAAAEERVIQKTELPQLIMLVEQVGISEAEQEELAQTIVLEGMGLPSEEAEQEDMRLLFHNMLEVMEHVERCELHIQPSLHLP